MDSFESEDAQTLNKRLRKVDTADLNFDALCDDMGKWPCKKKKRKTMVFRRQALK